MRTLTVYVVTHADEPPLCVFPTMKKANAYREEMEKEHGDCDQWRAEAHRTPDNSAGLAELMNWILTQSCDVICAGMSAPFELATAEKERQESIGLAGLYAAELMRHGLSPNSAIDAAQDRATASQNEVDVAKIVALIESFGLVHPGKTKLTEVPK